MASVHFIVILLTCLLLCTMDHLSKVDSVKFRDKVKLTSEQDPRIFNRADYDEDRVSVILNIPRRFFIDLQQCHDNTGFSYTSLLNAHVNIITICQTERLEERLRRKCSDVKSELRRKHNKAGTAKREKYLLQEIKTSLYRSEVLNASELVICNIQFHEEIVQLRAEYDVVLSSLQTAVRQNKAKDRNIEKLKQQNASLHKYIKEKYKVDDPENKGGGVDDVKYRQRKRKLDSLKTDINASLWFAESYDLVPEAVKLRSSKSGQTVNLNLTRKTGEKVPTYDKLSHQDKEKIQQLTLILDQFGVSENTYHELHMVCDGSPLPSKKLVSQCRKDLNKLTEINRLPGKKPGAFVSFSTEIGKIIKSNPDSLSLKIKFCGDGTRVSRIKNYVVLSYCHIKDEDSNAHHTLLAILQGDENYDLLKQSCSVVFDEVNSVIREGITIDGVNYKPEIFLGGDLKFLQTLQGLNVNSANAYYSCPICKVHIDNRSDLTKEWDFYHSSDMRRDYTTYCECIMGQKYQPLIQVDTDHIVPCLLHGLLRIHDVLNGNVILEMVQRDGRAKVDGQPQRFIRDFVELVRSCGVTYNVWEKTDSKKNIKHESTSLTGGAKLKVLELLPDKLRKSDLLYEESKEQICCLWEDFLSLFTKVAHCSSEDAQEVFNQSKSWVENFHNTPSRFGYSSSRMTPYMHIFCHHFPYYVSMYGGVSKYSGQGMEKLNDIVKFIHHRKTSRWDGEKDALTVGKRTEILADKARIKRPYNLTDEGREKLREARSSKRRAIDEEQQLHAAATAHGSESTGERRLDEMDVKELKEILKTYSVTTRVRTKHKLIAMIENEREKHKQ